MLILSKVKKSWAPVVLVSASGDQTLPQGLDIRKKYLSPLF